MDEPRESREDAASTRRLTLRSTADPAVEIDVTLSITRAVAEEIWRSTGGNAVLNWIEAEAFVERLLARLETPPASIPEPAVPAPARRRRPPRRTDHARPPERRRITALALPPGPPTPQARKTTPERAHAALLVDR